MFDSFGLGAYQRPMYDSVAGDAADQVAEMFDPIDEREILANIQSMRGLALQTVFLLVDAVQESAIPEEMSPSEFLDGLMITGLDSDDDDTVDPQLNADLSAHIADALGSLGVSGNIISNIMGDDAEAADAAIEAAAGTIIANMPDLGDALEHFSKEFIFGFEAKDMFADEDGFDAVSLSRPKHKPAVGSLSSKILNGQRLMYKAVKVIRNGIATVINKRVGGTVKLSPKQKASLQRLHQKAQSASSKQKRQRSLKKSHAMDAVKHANKGAYHPSKYIPMMNDPVHVKHALADAGAKAAKKAGDHKQHEYFKRTKKEHAQEMESTEAVKRANKGAYHPSKYIPEAGDPVHVKNALAKAGAKAAKKAGDNEMHERFKASNYTS